MTSPTSAARPTRVIGAALVTLLLTACASPFAEAPEARDDSQPFKELAARPSEEAAEEAKIPAEPEKTSKGNPGKERAGEGDGSEPSAAGEGEGSQDGTTRAPFVVVGSLSDPRSDVSADTPGYGDALSIEIASDGPRARISVTLDGNVPAALRSSEVEGVGVDLFRDSGDYQVFASGEPGGWYGYLYTPDGFVEYRGSFAVDGRTITFIVPWSALGGDGSGTFSAFVDWTGPPEGDRSPFSQDRVPEDGTADFTP